MKYAIGVDVGGTSLLACVMDEAGKMIKKITMPTDRSDHGANIIPSLASAINDLTSKGEPDPEDCLGIGLGVPGAVLADGTVNKCVNLGWGRIDAAGELSKLTGLKAYAVNDANAAALGESVYGAARGYDSAFLITIGTGIGGGLVINGHIVKGAFGGAGEVGHITVDPREEDACTCGKRGCLEQYCSATGIMRLVQKECPGRFGNVKEVYDAARDGDKAALKLTDKAADILAYGCSVIAAVADPDVFILGGGVAAAGDILIDAVRSRYAKYVFHASRDTGFATAQLCNDAGMMGAAAYVMGNVFPISSCRGVSRMNHPDNSR